MNNHLHIVTSADDRFVMQLEVLLKSLENHHQESELTCWVLTDSAALSENINRSGKRWVLPLLIDTDELHNIKPQNYPAASLWRLLLDRYLPEHVTRCIYIDADTLIQTPLIELWETETGKDTIAAVRDAGVPWAAAPYGLPWRELDIDPRLPYFNAGVMVIDRLKWKSLDVEKKALSLLDDYSFLYADQCALNVLFAGSVSWLHPKWNVQPLHFKESSLCWIAESPEWNREAIESPAILHYTNAKIGRPWTSGCTHPFLENWYHVLDQTNFTGWRPRKSSSDLNIISRIKFTLRRLFNG